MLDTLRRGASSLVAKILFGILVVSFAIWGIGDIFRGAGKQSWVAKVGDQEISGTALGNEYQRYLEQVRPMFQGKLDSELAKKLGFPKQVLQRMIGQALFNQAAHDLGIKVSNKTVRDRIESEPSFRGPGGKFDEFVFRQALARAGYTEEVFVETLRRELARNLVTATVQASGAAPKEMVDAIYKVRQEKRIADSVTIADTAMPDPPEPDEAALAAYHKENAAAFTAPEYRSITYATLTAENLAKDIEVSEDDLKQAYEDDKGHFGTPELRTVQQMVLPDEAAAKRAQDMLSQGKDFAAVAKEVANEDKDAIDLGTVTKEQLPPELRDVAFALQADGVSAPIKTALGWHILKVTAIKPTSAKTFEQVHDQLRQEVAQDRARDKMDTIANKLDDTLASGATIEEAADKLGLKAVTVNAVDMQGRGADGEPVAGLPGGSFLSTAFSTPEGKPTTLTEIPNDGYFVLRVNKVTPSALRPLDSVRDQVASAWKGQQRHKEAKVKAEEIAAKVKGGQSLSQAVTGTRLDVKTVGPFQRGEKETLPEAVVNAIFQGKTGDVSTGEAPDGYVVAQLREIIPANPATDKDGVAGIQQQLDGAMGNDFLVEYGSALEARYPVRINEKAFDALFSQ